MASQKYPTNKTQERATKAVIVSSLLLKRRTSDETVHTEQLQGTVTRGKRRRQKELKEVLCKQGVRRMNRIIKVKKSDDFEYEGNRVKVKIEDRKRMPFESDKGENNNMTKRCKSTSGHKVKQLRAGDSGNLNDQRKKRIPTEGLDNLVTTFNNWEKVGKRRNRKSFEVDINDTGIKTNVNKIGKKTESTSERKVRKNCVEGTHIEGHKTETVETSTSKGKIVKIGEQATEDMDDNATETVEANTSKRKAMKISIETTENKKFVKNKVVEANTGKRHMLKICVQHTEDIGSDRIEAVEIAKANTYKRSARNIKKKIDDNFVYDNTDKTRKDVEPDESEIELNTSGSSLGEEIPQESSEIKQKGGNKCANIKQNSSETEDLQRKSDLTDESIRGNEEHCKFLFDIKQEITDSGQLIESNECELDTEYDDYLTESKKRELSDKVCMSKTATTETTVSRIGKNEMHRKTQKSILCAFCDLSVATQTQMKRHLKLVHTFVAEKSQLFKCTYDGCSKVFSRLPNCKKHIDGVHLNLRNFMCEVCKFKFKTASSLKMHTVARHPVDEHRKMFKCQVCEKTFLRKAGLQLHESLHTNIKSYTCGFKGCGKSFRLKSNLTKHDKVHADVRNYHCNLCEERFSRKIYLETHMYKHTGVKAFQCDVCQKSYTQKGNLMTHKVLHTRERIVFNCPKCYQTFNFKSNMTKHLRQHDLHDVSKRNATMNLSDEFKEVGKKLFKIRPKLKKDRGMDGSFAGVSKNLEKGSAQSPESVALTGASCASRQQKYFVSPSIYRAIEDNRNTKSVILMIQQYEGLETCNISEKVGLKTIKSGELGKLITPKIATGGIGENEGALGTGEAENEKDAFSEAQVNSEVLKKSVACNTEENTTDNLISYEIHCGLTKQNDNRNTSVASRYEVVSSSELSEIRSGLTSDITHVHAEELQSNGNAVNSQGSNKFTACGKTESLTSQSNTENETWNTVSAYTAVPVKEFTESGATEYCECIIKPSVEIETSQIIEGLEKSVIANIKQGRFKENNDYVVTESAIFQPEIVHDNDGVGESNRKMQNVNDGNEYVETDSKMLSTLFTPDSDSVNNLVTRPTVKLSVDDSNVNARFMFGSGPLDNMNILNQAAVGEEAPVTHLKETVISPSNDFIYYNATVTESQTIAYGQLVSDFVQTRSSTSEKAEGIHGETDHSTSAALSDEIDNLPEAGFISQISVGQQKIVQNVNPFDHDEDESIPESEIKSHICHTR